MLNPDRGKQHEHEHGAELYPTSACIVRGEAVLEVWTSNIGIKKYAKPRVCATMGGRVM